MQLLIHHEIDLRFFLFFNKKIVLLYFLGMFYFAFFHRIKILQNTINHFTVTFNLLKWFSTWILWFFQWNIYKRKKWLYFSLIFCFISFNLLFCTLTMTLVMMVRAAWPQPWFNKICNKLNGLKYLSFTIHCY